MNLVPGYLTQPTLFRRQIAFICDDDLWSVSDRGGKAERLTANLGQVSRPCFSPDGRWIAFCGTESGQKDVYLIPAEGGEFQRLTYLGIHNILGWRDKDTIIFNSIHESFHRSVPLVYFLNIKTEQIKKSPYGPAHALAFSEQGKVLVGRNCRDSSRWKRYRGGTAGVFWMGSEKGSFQRILSSIEYNLTDPLWVKDRLYFVSDHEGIAQVYSCSATGKNVKCLTDHRNFYVRGLKSDGERLIYHAGGDIFLCSLKGERQKLEIQVPTPGIQAQPRFEDAFDYLDDYHVNNKGTELAAVTRGHLFRLPPWDQGTIEAPDHDGARHRLPLYLGEGESLLVVRSDHAQAETLHIIDCKTNQRRQIFEKRNWGKIWELVKNPCRDQVVLINNRNEIFDLDLRARRLRRIEKSSFGRFSNPSFSPDGRYLVYTAHYTQDRTGIRLYDLKTKNLRWMIEPVLSDWSGSFDLSGKYFYFLSIREFQPTYSWTHFDLSFPFAGRPYVVTLDRTTPDPFQAATETEPPPKEKRGKKPAPPPVKIDWKDLDQRIQPLPVRLGGYLSLVGLENKVLYFRSKVQPTAPFDWLRDKDAPDLFQFSFDRKKEELYQAGVRSYELSSNRQHILIKTKSRLRLQSTKDLPKDGMAFDKSDGWVDLSRIRLKIDPRAEWRQMYREAWELQKEHFWDEKLASVDWDVVYKRYLPLVERVRTRGEMSDLLWEMQGELGTSHCYEYFGDYFRRPPLHWVGYLGGEFRFVKAKKGFLIEKLYRGDSWIEEGSSPLLGPKAGLEPGDTILSVDGRRLDHPNSLGLHLLGKAGTGVTLEVLRRGKKRSEMIAVTALNEQTTLQYRRWVESRRELVHKLSGGKLGYIHIPDMGTEGFAEFYRLFLAEFNRSGLVVDVRYNGGGSVSQLLLKMLDQKILGFDQTRWNGIVPYPSYAVNGPLVAVTNEHAGSDGDIFCHAFKMMKLGPLVGKRTWGGVIGINGQYSLRDGTITTQPEYSFWFKDVGWNVENYGTDPDIEVDWTPADWARGKDPQLEKAVAVALDLLKKNPPLRPKLDQRPNLKLPSTDL